MSCPLVLLPLCPRAVPTEGYLVAKSMWTVGCKVSIVGPSPAHPKQKQLEVALTNASGSTEWLWPTFRSFSSEPLSRLVLREHPVLFSETQGGSRTEKVPASIWGLSSGVFVGPCRRCCPCIPKTFRDLVARHPDRAPVDSVFGVAFMLSVSLGCLK